MPHGELAECRGNRINPAISELSSEERVLWSVPMSRVSSTPIFKENLKYLQIDPESQGRKHSYLVVDRELIVGSKCQLFSPKLVFPKFQNYLASKVIWT